MEQNDMIQIKSPLNGEIIGNVPAMTQSRVNEIIIKAKESLKEWKEKTLNDRIQYLYKAGELLLENEKELSALLVKEVGKDTKSAKSEVVRTADFIKFTADAAKNMHGQNLGADSFPGGKKGKFAITTREPVGVVLAISPFNYPVNLAASKIAPALAGGNTVILKPATQGSLCGTFLVDIFKKAGLPDGVLGVVTGFGSEIGDYIVTHPDINFINFTGSTEVGHHIAKQAEMIPLLMELGGKDAAIVLEDADLNLAASQIVSGAFSYSGQRCTAIKRVIVLDKVADDLVQKIKSEIKKLKVGNPLEGDGVYDVVPLISKKAADYVESLIKDATDKGAVIICGGNRKGSLIEPTLIDNVTEDMKIAWEEPFGPVLPVLHVNSINDAITLANKSEYGLQSSVFTKNINNAFYIAGKLEVGAVQINNKTERGPDHLPFLGVKKSGIGVQGITYSIDAMTRIKSTVINL